ncbi:DUF3291 domain-containing protein [Marinicella sediminis]|uniref:DUF3291 domain-containing protein n=1 Tax=Marinicella sediminis TaxID=1792834 RepID=A0ABV7JBC0_9GAMM|nr:DUF3291 domain-containing protein [Marinicella sediminis]
MKYQLAQLNIAQFRLPQEHPANADFVNNLDRVNALAESHPGFVWRFTGEGNDALDVQAFTDPLIAVNLSVWQDVYSLVDFVYRNAGHTQIMRRRKEWFDKLDVHMVLWWVEQGRIPSLEEAKIRLELLRINGPTDAAFTFKHAFAPPNGKRIDVFKDHSD